MEVELRGVSARTNLAEPLRQASKSGPLMCRDPGPPEVQDRCMVDLAPDRKYVLVDGTHVLCCRTDEVENFRYPGANRDASVSQGTGQHR